MTDGGGVVVRTVLDTGAGKEGAAKPGLCRRLVEMAVGARFEGTAGPGGELWFVIAGTGRMTSAGGPGMPVRPDTGLWLPPGTGYCLRAGDPGPLRLDSVRLPAEAADPSGDAAPRSSELRDCAVQVTGDRRFRILFGPGRGCEAATQFVGEIPPGRAPDHSHPYDEVVLVLAGTGVLHAGSNDHPLAPDGCVHLPPGQAHCLENTGDTTLRVLGVFHPGGSPAAKQSRPSPADR